ncbi:Piso0_000622 [Millerozyma farinosa CBS 7064]|uniref:Piso0_000622 protein n=1 Tax=Pichia sorbitophila (strain ATCC MYA-4447 / BCRC 22081 / CBS 7064 / NBRC 10061 / NRRL Y-12695) TaxID=559304 RepID=G8YR23_PICSO|nr:Piso0_000622 [Millerozyma farinosa CBS 7064]
MRRHRVDMSLAHRLVDKLKSAEKRKGKGWKSGIRSPASAKPDTKEEDADEEDLSDTQPKEVDEEELEIFNRFKTTDIENAFGEEAESGGIVAMNNVDCGSINSDYFNISFDTDDEDAESQQESVLMEFTPFEDEPVIPADGFRRTVAKMFRKMVSRQSLELLKKEQPEVIGDNYLPVSLKIPVIEDIDDYKKLDLSLFQDEKKIDDSKIKFNDFAEVMFYNGNYESTKSNKPVQPNRSYVHHQPETPKESGRSTIGRSFSLSKSSVRHPFSKTSKANSILKNKTNDNFEYETLQLREKDKVNFENFMMDFEHYEAMKMDQEPYLNNLRLNQLKNYYESEYYNKPVE